MEEVVSTYIVEESTVDGRPVVRLLDLSGCIGCDSANVDSQ